MFGVPHLAVMIGIAGAVLLLASVEGAAQQHLDTSTVVYEAARNKIGLMRYCRNKELIQAGIADKAAAAVRMGLVRMAVNPARAKQRGDIAEKAGEEGFWEASRRHDMAAIAGMFGTTPAGLCQEWASETLRSRNMAKLRDVTPAASLQALRAPVTAPRSREALPPHRAAISRIIQKSAGVKPSATPTKAPDQAIVARAPAAVPVAARIEIPASEKPETIAPATMKEPAPSPVSPAQATPAQAPAREASIAAREAAVAAREAALDAREAAERVDEPTTANWATGPIVIWLPGPPRLRVRPEQTAVPRQEREGDNEKTASRMSPVSPTKKDPGPREAPWRK